MTSGDRIHLDECPICHVTCLGFTESDMVEHFIEDHERLGEELSRILGIDDRLVSCDDCLREYLEDADSCPWCEGA